MSRRFLVGGMASRTVCDLTVTSRRCISVRGAWLAIHRSSSWCAVIILMTMSDDRLRLLIRANGARFISMNNANSGHWSSSYKLRSHWRHNTQLALADARFPKGLPPSEIRSMFFFSTQRRRDPHNFVATLKPIVDQLVTWGCWPDDNADYVSVAEPLLSTSVIPAVSLIITPRESHDYPTPSSSHHF